MRPYLSSYVKTLSRQRSERVSTLLEEARVGKERLDQLAKRLERSVNDYNTLILRKDDADRRITSQVPSLNLRDMGIRINDLYRISNLISLLLESHASVLSSDVKTLEEELLSMEKMASNFAFLLSDNQTFDFAHLEPFNDERSRDLNVSVFTDRNNSVFSSTEQASVRLGGGNLVLPQPFKNGYGLNVSLVKSNVLANKLFETDLKNTLKESSSSGWIFEVASPHPITSSLPEAGVSGAQVMLEFEIGEPAPATEIRLAPHADIPMEVLQVTIFKGDNNDDKSDLLDIPRKLDTPLILTFPMQSVKRFRVLLNQSVYKRIDRVENRTETEYRKKVRNILEEKGEQESNYHRSFRIRKLERQLQTRVNKRIPSVALPNTDLRFDKGPLTRENLLSMVGHNNAKGWSKPTGRFSQFVYDIIGGSDSDLDRLRRQSNEDLTNQSDVLQGEGVTSQSVPVKTKSQQNNPYRYLLGLAYVGIGVESPKFKGVFISKPLPSSGDVGEIRLRAGVENYVLPVTDRASNVLTSVEFSVSNESDPNDEDAWIPILPVGESRVHGERVFLDENGNGYLRFEASKEDAFTLYRNGYKMRSFSFLDGRPGAVRGVKVDVGTISENDILTCDYYTAVNETTVNFEAQGFSEKPLVSAFDENGAGERFNSTSSDRNTVTLSHLPYVDPSQIDEVYSPITVLLDDGSVAINLTDYETFNNPPLPTDGNQYYIHSGNTLIFNEAIIDPFTVFYQYLKNNVRFRVVLRCNDVDFVSPKVDFIQVKAKTRRADTVTNSLGGL